jgi:hypothetical protein
MNFFIGNKRGFLLAEETLKIIIALICIVFLVYILIAIYNASSSDKKIEQAKDILSRIEAITSSLKEGETQRQDIVNPAGWHLYTFVGEEKPNSCANERCLCICEKPLIKQLTSQTSKCDKDGSCLIIKNLASEDVDLKIRSADNILFVSIKKQNNRIFIGE